MKKLIRLSKHIAKTFHAGQKYGTKDYFKYHVTGVVNLVKLHKLSDTHIIVANLHDVVEDTSVTIETIYNLFGPIIGDAVKAITKIKGVPYEEYLEVCAKNKIARTVKFHDACFNASNCAKNKNTSRYNHYLNCISKLQA